MSKFLAAKLKKDKGYLEEFFSNIEDMEGIIIRIQVEEGYDNYRKNIKDPMEEETMILRDNYEGILLVFNHSTYTPRKLIFEGVTIIQRFSYTEGCFIHKKCKPVDVPYHLKDYVFGQHFEDTRGLENTLEKLQIKDSSEIRSDILFNNFIHMYYKLGQMTSYTEMKLLRGLHWKESELMFEKRYVNICKSCSKHAKKGCCKEYSASNRSKKLMVIGLEKK